MSVLDHRVIATCLLTLVILSPMVLVRTVLGESAAPTWDRTYMPTIGEGVNSVDQTRDNGFIMSDYGRVMKTNAAGMLEWERGYWPVTRGAGVFSYPYGRVAQTDDSGYIVAGSALGTKPTLIGYDNVAWLLKLDHRGNVEWSRSYDMPGEEGFLLARQTSDGGYIALGTWTPSWSLFSQAWLVKLSPTGDVEWQHAYAAVAFVEPQSVQQTADGGFIVAGALPLYNSQRAWVFKTDQMGSMVWQKAYAVPVENAVIDDHAHWVHQTSDGGYVVVSDVTVFRNGGAESALAWILRLDADGSIVWQKLYNGGGGGFTTPVSVDDMSDGGFIVAGNFRVSRSGNGPGGPWLLRLNAEGGSVWQKIYPGGVFSEARGTRNGGIIAVGSCCGGFASALRLDSDGSVHGCSVGVSSNATLTDTDSIVTDTNITSVDTSAAVTPVSVTVTTPTFPTQEQCTALPNKNQS